VTKSLQGLLLVTNGSNDLFFSDPLGACGVSLARQLCGLALQLVEPGLRSLVLLAAKGLLFDPELEDPALELIDGGMLSISILILSPPVDEIVLSGKNRSVMYRLRAQRPRPAASWMRTPWCTS
jgi:hypothetical protein